MSTGWKSSMRMLVVILSVPLFMGQVCVPQQTPPPQQQNQPPVANAGPDQNVTIGDTVTLNGSGSSDSDGDPLTFAWSVQAGAVILSNPNSVVTTFVAPGTPGVVVVQLTVSDGQGGTSTDFVTVNVAASGGGVTQTPILLIANINGNRVLGYDISNVNNVNGNIAPGANLSGAQTLLSAPTDIVVNANGALLVSNNGTDSVTSYPNAANLSGINGNVPPDRNVQGAATGLATPASIAIQPANDLLFVSDIAVPYAVRVFANVSTAGFNGNLPPIRTITSTDLQSPIGINFGAGDTLYVANSAGIPRVSVFANASSANGPTAATRVITSAGAFTGLFDVYVDGSDRLFVVDSGDDQIHVFNNASTLNGNVAPSVTLTIPGAGTLTAIAVDTAGTGYVVDFALNAVYSYDNIATRNGTIPPDRTLQGANTQLLGPIRVFLLD